ncbi:MAG: efflux transporter periplasmic adaptor subunit, partial [Muribaculaceae bacterium]|nr:efflux transporter periplasmic adaptor subunit [Muribaculaceae bacterium]
FVRLDDEHYEKRPVTLGAKAGDRVEIVSGLTAGESIVTEGTPFVKLAESAGAAVPGHTHNH